MKKLLSVIIFLLAATMVIGASYTFYPLENETPSAENPYGKLNSTSHQDLYYGLHDDSVGLQWEIRSGVLPGEGLHSSLATSGGTDGAWTDKQVTALPDNPSSGYNVRYYDSAGRYHSLTSGGTDTVIANPNTTFYVNGDDGTDSPIKGTSSGTGAWKTIPYAASRVPSGSTVYVKNGTYTLAANLTLADSKNNITWIAWDGSTASNTGWSDVTAELSCSAAGLAGTASSQGIVIDEGALLETASTQTLGSSNKAGDSDIDVVNQAGFTAGGVIVIDPRGEHEEVHIIKSVSGIKLEIEGKLAYTQSAATDIIQGAYAGKWVKFESDTTTSALRGIYRLIDWNTDGMLKTIGTLPAQPQSGDTYKIVDPGVTIAGGSSYSVTITRSNSINMSGFIVDNTASGYALTYSRSSGQLTACSVAGKIQLANMSYLSSYWSKYGANGKALAVIIDVGYNSNLYYSYSLCRGEAAQGISVFGNSYAVLTDYSKIDGCAYAAFAQLGGTINMYSAYNRIMDSTTYGLIAATGGKIYGTTNNVYAGNGASGTTHETANATQLSYID